MLPYYNQTSIQLINSNHQLSPRPLQTATLHLSQCIIKPCTTVPIRQEQNPKETKQNKEQDNENAVFHFIVVGYSHRAGDGGVRRFPPCGASHSAEPPCGDGGAQGS